jgi:hypothetical protein
VCKLRMYANARPLECEVTHTGVCGLLLYNYFFANEKYLLLLFITKQCTWTCTNSPQKSIKSMLLNRTVIRQLDITLCSFMHYTTKHHLCRHNGSLFDVKWRIKFSCKINFTAVSFISVERMRKGRL